jgi:hypothetical protein
MLDFKKVFYVKIVGGVFFWLITSVNEADIAALKYNFRHKLRMRVMIFSAFYRPSGPYNYYL